MSPTFKLSPLERMGWKRAQALGWSIFDSSDLHAYDASNREGKELSLPHAVRSCCWPVFVHGHISSAHCRNVQKASWTECLSWSKLACCLYITCCFHIPAIPGIDNRIAAPLRGLTSSGFADLFRSSFPGRGQTKRLVSWRVARRFCPLWWCSSGPVSAHWAQSLC